MELEAVDEGMLGELVVAVDPDGRFFLVADGMGGQSAGEQASEMAIELIVDKLETQLDFDDTAHDTVIETIDQAVAFANTEIVALAQLEPRFHNMGTTVVFVIAAGGRFYSGGIGDSRVYRLRNGEFEQLTTDHSLTQALLDAGLSEVEARKILGSNVLRVLRENLP